MSVTALNAVPGGSLPPSSTEAVIDKFVDAIWLERGLSANTLGAYRADLLALQRWLTQRDKSLIYAARADLLAFIAWRAKEGAKPRSTARQLSSFRRFYRFLLRESVITEDPTLKIGAARPLWKTSDRSVRNPEDYTVSADGQRFLMKVSVGKEPAPPITIVQDWTGTLKR